MTTWAAWDWRAGAALPDAQVVVCAPGIVSRSSTVIVTLAATGVRPDASLIVINRNGGIPLVYWTLLAKEQYLVVPTQDLSVWRAVDEARSIPALHVRRQADLAGLPALLAVKAKPHVLVVEPLEDLILDCAPCERHERYSVTAFPSICSACRLHNLEGVDLVVIAGFDAPLRPDHVSSVVAQCRAASVPVVVVPSAAAPVSPRE